MKFQCGSENEQQTGCDIIHSEERPPSIFVIETVQSRKKRELASSKYSVKYTKKKYERVHVSGLSYWGVSSLLYLVCMSCVYV